MEESLFSFQDCFAGPQRIFLHEITHCVFERNFSLLKTWLENAGHSIEPDASLCTAQVCIMKCAPIPEVPLIIVSTEQPLGWFFHEQKDANKLLYGKADWIWCMDDVDYKYLKDWFEIPAEKLRILPLMFGTYYIPSAFQTRALPPEIDVFQFGTGNERRLAVMADLKKRRPSCNQLMVQVLFDQVELCKILQRTKIVIIPHYYTEPVSLGLHRLAFLLNFPHLTIIVEDAPSSNCVRKLVVWLDRFVLVPYESLVDTVIAELDKTSLESKTCNQANIDAFADAILHWKGDLSWLTYLTLDKKSGSCKI